MSFYVVLFIVFTLEFLAWFPHCMVSITTTSTMGQMAGLNGNGNENFVIVVSKFAR